MKLRNTLLAKTLEKLRTESTALGSFGRCPRLAPPDLGLPVPLLREEGPRRHRLSQAPAPPAALD